MSRKDYSTVMPLNSLYLSINYVFSTDWVRSLSSRWTNRWGNGGSCRENGIHPRLAPPIYPYDLKRNIFRLEDRDGVSKPRA